MANLRYTSADGDVSHTHTIGDPERALVALRYITDAYLGEPLFVIRARDYLAVPAAQHYLGLVHNAPVIVGPVFEAVQADITAISAWQYANPNLLKFPDRPTPGA